MQHCNDRIRLRNVRVKTRLRIRTKLTQIRDDYPKSTNMILVFHREDANRECKPDLDLPGRQPTKYQRQINRSGQISIHFRTLT